MKHTLLIFLLFIFTKNYSQTETNLIHVPEVWENDIWNGTMWNLVSQTTFTFNGSCLATEGLSKFIDYGGSGMLENASYLTLTYNANDLPVESINQLWNEDTGTWEDQLKTEFFYTGTYLTEYINYDWLDDNWEPSNRELNTYNASNLITENITQTWDETNMVWMNNKKTEYTYNPNDSFNVVTIYDYNSSNSSWIYDTKETYNYTGNLLSSKKSDHWNSSAWENDRIRHYTYNSNDFLIETLKTKWNGNTFENENRVLQTNNNDGFPTQMVTQTWIFGSWLNASRDRRTYPNCSSLSIKDVEKPELKIYPNPTKNELNIKSKTSGVISITDLNGRLIKSFNHKNNTSKFDTAKISNGAYVLRFETDNIKVTKRLIINH
ncbi:T9SS type A sorting domain-containing protein [Algibacter pectinivorans]|uniref:Por secretion system C-terminal sorting domain-containing protein n=1 Tax=Algibacter pectinivorans TaxID=870482 RepID=A0A1I1NV43_9FLAO|nr:T9SS type A sorting domain-containing protein [Algibacter pectinivorans]SFC99378.1 Por secretion system C-terminal sorting domain-containing protein [Algibacter pectinivorans]